MKKLLAIIIQCLSLVDGFIGCPVLPSCGGDADLDSLVSDRLLITSVNLIDCNTTGFRINRVCSCCEFSFMRSGKCPRTLFLYSLAHCCDHSLSSAGFQNEKKENKLERQCFEWFWTSEVGTNCLLGLFDLLILKQSPVKCQSKFSSHGSIIKVILFPIFSTTCASALTLTVQKL